MASPTALRLQRVSVRVNCVNMMTRHALLKISNPHPLTPGPPPPLGSLFTWGVSSLGRLGLGKKLSETVSQPTQVCLTPCCPTLCRQTPQPNVS